MFFLVEPRGVEPRSTDFQSVAYTKSAKVPSNVTRERFELPTLTFVASCSNPTELTSHNSVLYSDAKVQWVNAAFFRSRKKLKNNFYKKFRIDNNLF